jgi:hypothetical protein
MNYLFETETVFVRAVQCTLECTLADFNEIVKPLPTASSRAQSSELFDGSQSTAKMNSLDQ